MKTIFFSFLSQKVKDLW